jgi:hypothetical protein
MGRLADFGDPLIVQTLFVGRLYLLIIHGSVPDRWQLGNFRFEFALDDPNPQLLSGDLAFGARHSFPATPGHVAEPRRTIHSATPVSA